jgi:hypothetical protein
MPFVLPPGWTPIRVTLLVGMELMCVALLAGLWLPARYGHWAFRVFSGVLFLGYAGYLIDMTMVFLGVDFLKDAPGVGVGSRGATPFTDLMRAFTAFAIIGLPGLWFSLFGRFTQRETSE